MKGYSSKTKNLRIPFLLQMDFPGGDEQDEEETEININGFAAGKVFFVTGSLSDVGQQEVVPLKPVSEKGGKGAEGRCPSSRRK